MIFRRAGPTVLTLDRAALAHRAAADGKLDLVEALQTVIAHPDPHRDLTVRITDGSLIFRADRLPTRSSRRSADFDLQIPPRRGR